MEESKKINTSFQNIILENRERLNITGILDVLSFDDQIIIVETELGLLTIKGENLKINKLSLDTSDFVVDRKDIQFNLFRNKHSYKKRKKSFK